LLRNFSRIAQLEQVIEDARAELIESSNKTDQTFSKMEIMQGQMKLLTEEKERTQRDSLSLQKQLDYYKVCKYQFPTDLSGRN
jgi:septal ring factor EnvC (AmiA/AmiB activator)